MKGLLITTNNLLAAFTGTKKEKHIANGFTQTTLLTHAMLRSRRSEMADCSQPLYRSVTACIH